MSAWIFRACLLLGLLAAGFAFGWTWGFPDSRLHQIAAAAGIAIAILLLVEAVRRAARDLRVMRDREKAELAGEIRRHEGSESDAN